MAKHLVRLGCPNPQPLRSSQYPAGLPSLQGRDLARVQAANKIYDLCYETAIVCLETEVAFGIENPRGSYMWEYGGFPALLSRDDVEANDLQNCMFGSERDKWSRWVSTKFLFRPLRLVCDNSHKHSPWGFVDNASWKFATALEAEYQPALCYSAMICIRERALARGFAQSADSLSSAVLNERQKKLKTRAGTGKLPRGRVLPQLIPEFDRIGEAAADPKDKMTKVLRQFKRGGDGSQQKDVFVVGHYKTPEAFLEAARTVTHPADMTKTTHDRIKRTLFSIATLGPVQLSKNRLQAVVELRKREAALKQEEEQLHSSMSGPVQKVLNGKNLLLLKSYAEEVGCADTTIIDELISGINLVGRTGYSNELPTKLRPATLHEAELAENSEWNRAATISTCTASGNPGLDIQVFNQCLDERNSGWVDGPFTELQIDNFLGPKWICCRRFGLMQGDKMRVIDDAKQPGLNEALTTTEKLQLHDLDDLAQVLTQIMTMVDDQGRIKLVLEDDSQLCGLLHPEWGEVPKFLTWLGRTLDLKAAYKQLAVNPNSYWCSVLVAFDPGKQAPAFFLSRSLLFGSTAAVYSFNRIAKLIWTVVVTKFLLVCTQFYDDYPTVEPLQTSALAKSTFEAVLRAFGWPWSEGPKDRPFAKVFNALGAEVDLEGMPNRSVAFGNKPERIASILAAAQIYKLRGRASKHEAAALHGKIQFAGTQIFGKAALPSMRILSRISSGQIVDKHELLSALVDLESYFVTAVPRLLTVAGTERPIIIFTDGSSEGEIHQWGLLYFDSDSGEKVWAAGHVPYLWIYGAAWQDSR